MNDFDYSDGLDDTGKSVWVMFADNHTEPDELLQLRQLCKLHDTLDQLDQVIRENGYMVRGQQSSTVLSGAVTERRMTVAAISTLFKQLGYKPATEDPKTRTERARAAARARWN